MPSDEHRPQPGFEAVDHRSNLRVRRLMREYKEMVKLSRVERPPFVVDLVKDSLFEWSVKLFELDTDSRLAAEMRSLGVEHILLSVTFPANYPFEPPFVSVVAPILEKGFVMDGGAICMELLTRTGWSSAYSMDSVLRQIAAGFTKGGARIVSTTKKFSRKSAVQR